MIHHVAMIDAKGDTVFFVAHSREELYADLYDWVKENWDHPTMSFDPSWHEEEAVMYYFTNNDDDYLHTGIATPGNEIPF